MSEAERTLDRAPLRVAWRPPDGDALQIAGLERARRMRHPQALGQQQLEFVAMRPR